ncbi:MAG: hypothetical protein ACI30R_05745 [Sodaliphilus sp.]
MKFSKILKYGSIFVATMMVCFVVGLCVGGLLRGISLQEMFVEKGAKIVDFAGIMLVFLVLFFPGGGAFCHRPRIRAFPLWTALRL